MCFFGVLLRVKDAKKYEQEHEYFCMSAIQVSGTESVRLGAPIRLLCNVTGSRVESRDVSWYRGSSVVRNNERAGVLVLRRSNDENRSTAVALRISASGPRDAGKYTCRTADRRLSASIFVHVTPDGTSSPILYWRLLVASMKSWMVHHWNIAKRFAKGEELICLSLSLCVFVYILRNMLSYRNE